MVWALPLLTTELSPCCLTAVLLIAGKKRQFHFFAAIAPIADFGDDGQVGLNALNFQLAADQLFMAGARCHLKLIGQKLVCIITDGVCDLLSYHESPN